MEPCLFVSPLQMGNQSRKEGVPGWQSFRFAGIRDILGKTQDRW